jgi:hypothetical protein
MQHVEGERQRAADRQPHQRADRNDLRVRRRTQLREFGAGIYTANLVAVAMIREMARS